MRALVSMAAMLAVASGAAAAGRPAPATTVLVGRSWLGLWRGGRVAVRRPLPGWTLGAARLRGTTVEVAATRDEATESDDTVLFFDAGTLAPRGRGHDAALARAEGRSPIGVDSGVPDDRAALSAKTARRVPSAARVVLSADGATMAMFAPATTTGAPWRGRLLDATTARPLAGEAPIIDDGGTRENGAARAVACLLPRGEGVIYTLLGAPADRVSEYQRFAAGATPVTLTTDYVMSCLAARRP